MNQITDSGCAFIGMAPSDLSCQVEVITLRLILPHLNPWKSAPLVSASCRVASARFLSLHGDTPEFVFTPCHTSNGNLYEDLRPLPLRANIPETAVVLLINEQGEKEKGRDEWHFS